MIMIHAIMLSLLKKKFHAILNEMTRTTTLLDAPGIFQLCSESPNHPQKWLKTGKKNNKVTLILGGFWMFLEV